MEGFLTKEEELERGRIIKRFREGDSTITREACDKAVEELFFSNQLSIYKCVSRYLKAYNCTHFYPQDSANSDGAIAFIDFVRNRYDPDKGCKVMTLAYRYIQKYLDIQANLSRPIPMSLHRGYQYINICNAITKYEASGEQGDMVEFIQSECPKISRENIIKMLHIHSGVSSFDFKIKNDDYSPATLESLVADDDTKYMYDDLNISIDIQRALDELTEEERNLFLDSVYVDSKDKRHLHKKYEMTEVQCKKKIMDIRKRLKRSIGSVRD